MRQASTALINLLNGWTPDQTLFVADLLTIIPLVGPTYRITNAQQDVVGITSRVDNASHTFSAGGEGQTYPSFSRGQYKLVVGLEVDSMTLTMICDTSQFFTLNLPWPQAARLGLLDGATVVIERAFTDTWGDWHYGTLIEFWGRTGDAQPSRTNVALTVLSELALLDLPMPRNTYQASCLHALYDAGCTLSRASFISHGIVGIGPTASALPTNLVQGDGYFNLGTITFTSGVLNGLSFTVKSYASSIVSPIAALPLIPSNGDTFDIVPGCDKTQTTCNSKFSNLAHFRGYPYIPVPETSA